MKEGEKRKMELIWIWIGSCIAINLICSHFIAYNFGKMKMLKIFDEWIQEVKKKLEEDVERMK